MEVYMEKQTQKSLIKKKREEILAKNTIGGLIRGDKEENWEKNLFKKKKRGNIGKKHYLRTYKG